MRKKIERAASKYADKIAASRHIYLLHIYVCMKIYIICNNMSVCGAWPHCPIIRGSGKIVDANN